MAKRELIDRKALIDNGLSKGFCEWYDEIKQAEVITEQEIVKPYFDRLSNEVLRATWDAYYMPVNTLSCDEIQKLMDKVLSDKEIGI